MTCTPALAYCVLGCCVPLTVCWSYLITYTVCRLHVTGYNIWGGGAVEQWSPRKRHSLTVREMEIISGSTVEAPVGTTFIFHSYIPVDEVDNSYIDRMKLLGVRLSPNQLSAFLPFKDLKKIARLHNIEPVSNTPAARVTAMLAEHACDHCSQFCTFFEIVSDKAKVAMPQENTDAIRKRERKRFAYTKKKKFNSEFEVKDTHTGIRGGRVPKFPPPPASDDLVGRCISGFVDDTCPDVFEEAGCAVCGQLTPRRTLRPLVEISDLLTLLEGEGVTCRERFSVTDPISELDGPVLDPTCDHVCQECMSTLAAGRLPLKSLANNLWIGSIPEQLRDLTYAERVLIARVRHNRCVVRVASGRGRLSANAIMFSNPTATVWRMLPPSVDELSEVLAVVFMGPVRPAEDDWGRTPMLVRRNRVADALSWLKLNHRDYEDLEVPVDNLESYPLCGIPVGVQYTTSNHQTILMETRPH